MKKFVLGIVLGIVLAIPMSVSADWLQKQQAKPLMGVGCSNSVDSDGRVLGNCSITVHVFDDAGNKCYIASNNNSQGWPTPGISCVKD